MFSFILTYNFNFIMGSFWLFGSQWGIYQAMVSFDLFGAQQVILRGKIRFNNILILVTFLNFWGPNGLFLGPGLDSKSVLGSAPAVQQVLFYKVSSI